MGAGSVKALNVTENRRELPTQAKEVEIPWGSLRMQRGAGERRPSGGAVAGRVRRGAGGGFFNSELEGCGTAGRGYVPVNHVY